MRAIEAMHGEWKKKQIFSIYTNGTKETKYRYIIMYYEIQSKHSIIPQATPWKSIMYLISHSSIRPLQTIPNLMPNNMINVITENNIKHNTYKRARNCRITNGKSYVGSKEIKERGEVKNVFIIYYLLMNLFVIRVLAIEGFVLNQWERGHCRCATNKWNPIHGCVRSDAQNVFIDVWKIEIHCNL